MVNASTPSPTSVSSRRSSCYCHPSPSHHHSQRTDGSGMSLFWSTFLFSALVSRRRALALDAAVYALVAAVCIICYVNSLNGDFVHDDLVAVTTNPDVLGKNPVTELFVNDFWGKPMSDPVSHKSYRPLTVLTFRINHAVGGLSSWGYHVFNVCLHMVVCLLLLSLCLDVLRWSRGDALITAVLFAAHPIHTEAVSNIVGRAEVLSALFFFLSLILFLKSTSQNDNSIRWLLVSFACSTCALLAKEQGITVLPICVASRILQLWEHNRLRAPNEECLKKKFHFLIDFTLFSIIVTFVVLVVFRIWMLQGSMPKFSEQDNPASFSPCVLTRFYTYSFLAAFNFWMLLNPTTLSYDWQMGSLPLVTSALEVQNVLSMLLVAFLLLSLIRFLNDCCSTSSSSKMCDRKSLMLSMSILSLPFIPASNLFVTVGFVVAERVLYIPSAGFCILVTYGLRKLRHDFRRVSYVWKGLTLVLILLFMVRTMRRNQDWRSRETLFRSGLTSVPQNAKVHYNFANLQKDLGNVDSATEHYRIALSLWPNHASAHNNLGTLLSNIEDAEYHFKAALSINPQHPRALFNMGSLYSKQGKNLIAQEFFQKAIELDEEFTEAYSSLAAILAEAGNSDEAEALHLKALAVDRENPDSFNNYGTFLQKQGRVEEAVQQYKQAIALEPNHTVAIVNAARSLKALKNNREAEELYKRALTIHPEPKIMDNLGVLYISAGRIAEAKKIYNEMQEKYTDYLEGKVHLAQVLMQERSFLQAEQLLLEAVSSNLTHRDALHQLSLLYSQVNKTTEALEQILKALNLCSSSDTSCAQLHADHGDILKDLKYLDDAAQSYRMAIELDPKLSHAHVNLAVINHLQGDCHQALRHYHEAYILDPDNQLLQENMKKLKRHLVEGSGTCHTHHPAACQSR